MADLRTIQVRFPRTDRSYTYLAPVSLRLAIDDHVIVPTEEGWSIAKVSRLDSTIQLPVVRYPVTWKRILGPIYNLPPIVTLNVSRNELRGGG